MIQSLKWKQSLQAEGNKFVLGSANSFPKMKANVGSQVMVKELFCEPGIRTKKVKSIARLVGLRTLSLQPQNLLGMFGWIWFFPNLLDFAFADACLYWIPSTDGPSHSTEYNFVCFISSIKSALTFCGHLTINLHHNTKYYELAIILKYYELTFHEWVWFMLYWSDSSPREKYNIILGVCVG